MNDLINTTGATLTMSSIEIAELVGSRHDKVKQSIERLAEKGIFTLPPMGEVSNSGPGPKLIKEYRLDKRSSLIVVAQLCPQFTARIVDRWQELEEQVSQPTKIDVRDLSQLTTIAIQLIEVNKELTQRAETAEATVKEQESALELASTSIAAKDLCIAEQAPKVNFYDTVASAENVMTINVIAKTLGTGQNRMFALLREERVLRWDNVPYQVYIDKGYFEVIPKTFKGMGLGKEANFYSKTHVTGKGLIFITNLWLKHHPEDKGRRAAQRMLSFGKK